MKDAEENNYLQWRMNNQNIFQNYLLTFLLKYTVQKLTEEASDDTDELSGFFQVYNPELTAMGRWTDWGGVLDSTGICGLVEDTDEV